MRTVAWWVQTAHTAVLSAKRGRCWRRIWPPHLQHCPGFHHACRAALGSSEAETSWTAALASESQRDRTSLAESQRDGTPIRGTGSCESCSCSAAHLVRSQEDNHEEATNACCGGVACRDNGQCSNHRNDDGRGARGGSDRAAVSNQDQELHYREQGPPCSDDGKDRRWRQGAERSGKALQGSDRRNRGLRRDTSARARLR